ncbi:hypothetical protein BC830DRAFT_1175208 [Chytriomyces sp. MP71]|nr:hypothetical protein BC830DRAFT_1175208 [Chytriomyces sp. MP71]
MTTPAPVTLLRATNLPPLLDANGSATDDLRVASVAVFGEHLIRVDDASGYKRYPLLSLLFFLREALQGTDHASYMQRALAHWQGSAREAPPIVSVIDRRETLAYLTGESASLPGVGEAAGPGKRDHEAVVEDGEGEEERRVRVRMLEDFERLKENVLSKERCIVDLSNFLSRGVTKSFTNAIKYSSEILRPGAPTKVGTAVAAVPGSKANDPKARGSSSASKPPASLSAKPSTSSKKPSSSSKPAPSSSSKPNSKASTCESSSLSCEK